MGRALVLPYRRAMSVLTRHNVRTFGAGTVPMVFAHGFGCDQNMWRFVAPAFEHDYRIVLFDYLGHGQSKAAEYDRRSTTPCRATPTTWSGSPARSTSAMACSWDIP